MHCSCRMGKCMFVSLDFIKQAADKKKTQVYWLKAHFVCAWTFKLFKHFQYFFHALWGQLFPNFHYSELIKQNIKHSNQQAKQIINIFIVHVYSSFRLCEQKSKSESILPSTAFLQQLDNCAALAVVWPCQMGSLLPSTVSAQDVIPLGEESTAHQRHRALHTRETLTVPLPLFKRDVLSTCQAWTHT